ncbi:MAG: UPF0175 family protein [Deltaproteobacteria bacterium]|nr:UPF0175 family protein [Deltaproteobacteria bacterium]MBK7063648.1 UPF0175 family protein [Deltaproteobacteria bacterium]MBK8690972.1 UPF0175 family protein [Deltaproteobacteria bacterium]
MQHALTIEYGDDLLLALGVSPSEFADEARLLLAAQLYSRGRLTAGQASRLCGRERVDFLVEVSRLGFPAANLRPEDAATELAFARR